MSANPLRLAFRQRFMSEPHLINALVTGASVWPPDNETFDELHALAEDRIRDAETAEAHLAPSSIRLDELYAARDALLEHSVRRTASPDVRFGAPDVVSGGPVRGRSVSIHRAEPIGL